MEKSEFLKNIFSEFDNSEIEFVVLRKHVLIPDETSVDEDIDVFSEPRNRLKIKRILKERKCEHYTDNLVNNSYLYGAFPHEHYIFKDQDVHIDVVHSLAYRSLNQQEWIPVSKKMQLSLIENRIKEPDSVWLYRPSPVDELMHIICHCLLDKKQVKEYYAIRIKELIKEVDLSLLEEILGEVFFKFAPPLVRSLQNGTLENLYSEYLEYSEY